MSPLVRSALRNLNNVLFSLSMKGKDHIDYGRLCSEVDDKVDMNIVEGVKLARELDIQVRHTPYWVDRAIENEETMPRRGQRGSALAMMLVLFAVLALGLAVTLQLAFAVAQGEPATFATVLHAILAVLARIAGI